MLGAFPLGARPLAAGEDMSGGVAALAGTATVDFAASGSLVGTGTLAGSADVAFAASGAIVGTGYLSGSASFSFEASGTLDPGQRLKGRKSRLRYWRALYAENLAKEERHRREKLAELDRQERERQRTQEQIATERNRLEREKQERRAQVMRAELERIEREREQELMRDAITALQAQIALAEQRLIALDMERERLAHLAVLIAQDDEIFLLAA